MPETGCGCLWFTVRAVAFVSSAKIMIDLFFSIETLRACKTILSQEEGDVYKNVMLILSSLQLNFMCLFLHNSSSFSSVENTGFSERLNNSLVNSSLLWR